MKKVFALCAASFALAACLFGLAGCGSTDGTDLQGEWLVNDTTVTVVFTGDQLKMDGDVTLDYTLDTDAKTINYTYQEETSTSTYEFSEDKQTVTLTEDSGKGDATVFTKISDDTSAEPTADYDGEATSDSTSGSEESAK